MDYQLTENVSASLNYSFLLVDIQSKLSQFERPQQIFLIIEWLFEH